MTAGLRHALALALSVAAAAAGCGEVTRTVTAEDLESTLEDDIASTTATQVESVDCPGEEVEAGAGARAKCTVTLPDGRSGPVEITFSDNRGNFEYELAANAFE